MKALILVILLNILSLKSFAKEAQKLHPYLPQGTKPIGPNRFQSARNFDDTIKEIKRRLPNAQRTKLLSETINLPHVRACTLHMTDSKDELTAINIYLNNKTGITEVFFVGPPT